MGSHTIKKCCELLESSCSGFYHWLNRDPSDRHRKNQELEAKIVNIFEKSKGNYGSPRIYQTLKKSGEKIGKARVEKLMKRKGISARKKKAFHPKTTLNNPSLSKSPRVFKIEEKNVQRENQVWASDLTYLPTRSGFCYLVVVLDLFNREVKGWTLSESMNAEHTKNAFLDAVKSTSGHLKELTFHSDQGVQYCSSQVREKLKILNVRQSMSRKGNCYDNAFAESFFHTLKNELEKTKFENVEEARTMIFEYINWYNRERLHSSLGYLSPIEYVKQINPRVA